MRTISIAQNISQLNERVRLAAQKSQRDPANICILAVSKTRPENDIREAHAQGYRHFGENYLQEALGKMTQLADLDLCWHYIGPMQSNKTRPIAERFSWVHSVDRLKIAQRLSQQRPPGLAPLNVCLQVNISGEASKYGVNTDDLHSLAQATAQLPQLRLRGLMAIPAPSDNTHSQHLAFARLHTLLEQLQSNLPYLDTLSMGMSADLEAAITEGATIIRVGTDIFGAREKPVHNSTDH